MEPLGNPGLMAFKNWKECVWKNINSERDQGLIKVNTFFFYNLFILSRSYQVKREVLLFVFVKKQ